MYDGGMQDRYMVHTSKFSDSTIDGAEVFGGRLILLGERSGAASLIYPL